MYRSKRADIKYLTDKLKLAFLCLMLAFVGGVILLGQSRGNADETAPVSNEDTDNTYETDNGIAENTALTDGEALSEADDLADSASNLVPLSLDTERGPVIALTFDDGPSPFTNELLNILDEYGGRVTFCVIGTRVENSPEVVIRAYESGHQIIGHSWDHVQFGRLNLDQMTDQILRTSAIIDAVTGEPPPPIFRVPFGLFNARVQDAAIETGHSVLNWSVDPFDWRNRDADYVYEYIMENACDGAIIILHDIRQTTVEAMARVIPALIEQGYALVTATEVIDYVYGSLEPGVEYTGNYPD